MMQKKIAAVLTALVMLTGFVSAAAETTAQEKVYVVLDAGGAVQSITDIIRLENPDGLDEIADRTMLTGIENLGGRETFTLDGENLTWQAAGKDIIYQGTSGKEPAVLPVITITLDGEEITASELKNREGEATLTVSYRTDGNVPALAVTVLLLPEKGVSGLKTENALVLKEMGQEILIGYAIPGVDKGLQLPASSTVSFHADHADLKWAMTVITSDPLALVCREIDSRISFNISGELKNAETILAAVSSGESIPAVPGLTNMLAMKLNELNDGLAQLDDGAAQLKDGLHTLAENNDALNGGAEQIFAGILSAANTQIASSGLAEAGITLPELTADNYAQQLDTVITTLTLLGAASPEAKEGAKQLADLKEQLDQVQTFVTGLKTYTDGVAQASEGAGRLYTEGTQVLKASVTGAEKTAANLLLPYVRETLPGILDGYDAVRSRVGGAGYDLQGENIRTSTLYIMRTDLQ